MKKGHVLKAFRAGHITVSGYQDHHGMSLNPGSWLRSRKKPMVPDGSILSRKA